MSKLKLSKTVGGLKTPPTRRAKFETIWIDLIHASPANQVFRKRVAQYKDIKSVEELITDRTNDRDADDKIRMDLIEIVFNCWVYAWGGWDENGEATDLFDDGGDPVECTLDNFAQVVREIDGGEDLFFALLKICQQKAWFMAQQSEEEKNFLRPSPQPSTEGTSRRTRKGRKREAA